MSAAETGRNIAIVRELYESFADPARQNEAFEVFDPDIVWVPGAAEHVPLDAESEYRGHDGVRRFWRTWLGAWETVEPRLESTYAIGRTVVAFVNIRLRGRATGIEQEIVDTNIWTLENGLVVRFEIVPDREEALRRAGFDLERHRAMQAGYDAWNRRDFEGWLAIFDPDVEFVSQFEAVGGGMYAGRHELHRFWRDGEESFGELSLEPRDHEELGGDGWLVTGVGSVRGRESGTAADFPFAHLFRWRGGLVDRFLSVPSRDEALDAWEAARA